MTESPLPNLSEHEVLYIRAGRWQLRLTKQMTGSFEASLTSDGNGTVPEIILTQRISLIRLLATFFAIMLAYVAQFSFDATWVREQLVNSPQL